MYLSFNWLCYCLTYSDLCCAVVVSNSCTGFVPRLPGGWYQTPRAHYVEMHNGCRIFFQRSEFKRSFSAQIPNAHLDGNGPRGSLHWLMEVPWFSHYNTRKIYAQFVLAEVGDVESIKQSMIQFCEWNVRQW